MSRTRRQIALNLFIYPGGHHEAAWRHPSSTPERGLDITFYQELARKAEAVKFDAVFFADGPALQENIRYSQQIRLEPITLLTALATVTSRIGLIGTSSASYYDPYNFARLFASLDHISGGRAGWNIVTTSTERAAFNFGFPGQEPHAERYRRAAEFVDVVTKLWDSWEDGAPRYDKAAGIYADDALIHDIEHVGHYYRVKGALPVPRSPQGRPVYVQAGSSPDGRSFAARYAEAIFTAHQTIDSARDFYADIKAQAASLGRNPDHLKVLPGISAYIGGTEAEARALQQEFDDCIQIDYSLGQLRHFTGFDFSGIDLDAPFPLHLIEHHQARGHTSRTALIFDLLRREKLTLRQLIQRMAGARGHNVAVGTPEQVADIIEAWTQAGAADGFNVMPPWFPGGFDRFAESVVPILRKRSLFRDEYAGSTLRAHYGLPRPDSQFAVEQRKSA
jgi:FMN-dependent oxidoreductase (nitrilotriacetate monooxygenase family)